MIFLKMFAVYFTLFIRKSIILLFNLLLSLSEVNNYFTDRLESGDILRVGVAVGQSPEMSRRAELPRRRYNPRTYQRGSQSHFYKSEAHRFFESRWPFQKKKKEIL